MSTNNISSFRGDRDLLSRENDLKASIKELKCLLDECLGAQKECIPEPINRHKTSSDLLNVRFPTFVTRRSRSNSNAPIPEDIRVKIEMEPTEICKSKYSSMSNLSPQNTISRPDLFEVIQCIAKALYVHISRCTERSSKVYIDAFSEISYPLMPGWDTVRKPSDYVIAEYIRVIFQYHKMDVECAVMSLIYIERLLEITGLTMDATNWRRIILAAIIVSDKVWEEHAVWTQDFLHVFNYFITVQDLNCLELQFLGLIRFHLSINASTYATYYFELRGFSQEESKLPPRPLKKKAARRLERQSSKLHERPGDLGRGRSLSAVDTTTSPLIY